MKLEKIKKRQILCFAKIFSFQRNTLINQWAPHEVNLPILLSIDL